MKLLMVARRYPPDIRSGSETVFAALYAHAREHNEVQLVAGYAHDRSRIPAEALGVDLRGSRPGMAHLAMWRAARHAQRRFRPDAVLSNSIEVPGAAVPTATIVHDLNFGRAGRSWAHRLRERWYRHQAQRVARVIVVSEAVRAELLALGVAPDRVAVIHNGVDLDRFAPAPRAASDTLRLVYPGRILPGKGQHIAIDAVARLSHIAKRRVQLQIVGASADPVYLDQLRVAARGQPVSFHPDVDDIVPYYQAADLVLFPTLLAEGFGYTAVEAMACGRPVVWSDQPGVREATGGLGWPVAVGDVLALQHVVLERLASAKAFERVGVEGRAFVERRYAWGPVWQRYQAALEGIKASSRTGL